MNRKKRDKLSLFVEVGRGLGASLGEGRGTTQKTPESSSLGSTNFQLGGLKQGAFHHGCPPSTFAWASVFWK